MRGRCQVRYISMAIMVVLATAAGLTPLGPGAANAAVCQGWRVARPPTVGRGLNLFGVAVVPRTSRAWAAGQYTKDGNNHLAGVLLYWNGTRWQREPSPNPAPINTGLAGVAAVSATDAWAVGYFGGARSRFGRDLILHWDGTRWRRVPSPDPGGSNASSSLSGVAATSRRNAWAVGEDDYSALILHWNGKAWKRVPSPNAPNGGFPDAVAAVSRDDAWVVGAVDDGNTNGRTVIEHWNGKAWKLMPSPNPETGPSWEDTLTGVSATSATNAWAVGYALYEPPGGEAQMTSEVPIIEHWNGARWKLVHSPPAAVLTGVTAVSARNAWAVGSLGGGTLLIEHWNGRSWKRVTTPLIPGDTLLRGVAASHTGKAAWAVGSDLNAPRKELSLYHC
jgi:hypothetical protein